MKREYHRWYSHRLGLDMGVVVYGHWGPPLVGFPTSAGDEWELEGQGMIGALEPLIDAGRVKFFSVNSVNWAGFYNKGAHPFHRSYMQAQFDAYMREEVVPFIWDNCQSRACDFDDGGIVRGVSRGEYFVQASGRGAEVLCAFRRVRHSGIHERDVRRQHLFQ